MTSLSDTSACGNVWAAFYRAHPYLGDVAVEAALSFAPKEWERARAHALRNAKVCAKEAHRWLEIADELQARDDDLSGPA